MIHNLGTTTLKVFYRDFLGWSRIKAHFLDVVGKEYVYGIRGFYDEDKGMYIPHQDGDKVLLKDDWGGFNTLEDGYNLPELCDGAFYWNRVETEEGIEGYDLSIIELTEVIEWGLMFCERGEHIRLKQLDTRDYKPRRVDVAGIIGGGRYDRF